MALPTWLLVLVPTVAIVGGVVLLDPLTTAKALESFEVETIKTVFEDVRINNETIQVPKDVIVFELPEKPNINTKEIESKLLKLINDERSSLRLAQLRLDTNLSNIADKHTDNLIRLDQYGHVVNGQTPKSRMDNSNFVCNNPSWDKERKEIQYRYIQDRNTLVPQEYFDPNFYASEIINKVYIYEDDIAGELFNEWKESSGHYNIIKNKNIRVIGISVLEDNEWIVSTINFC